MYLYLKAFHIIFMVCWFAGIFYQFRLFVYHVEAKEQNIKDYLKIMERKLYKFMTPFMILTVIFGLSLTYLYTDHFHTFGDKSNIWIHIKLLLVMCLIAYHIYCGVVLKQLKEDRCKLTGKQCRLINEIPVFFLFAIVLIVVLKPVIG